MDTISKIKGDTEHKHTDYENALDDLVEAINELLGIIPPPAESSSAETKYTAGETSPSRSGLGSRPTSATETGFSTSRSASGLTPAETSPSRSGLGSRPTSATETGFSASRSASGLTPAETSPSRSGLGSRPTSATETGFSTSRSASGLTPAETSPSRSGLGSRPTSATETGFAPSFSGETNLTTGDLETEEAEEAKKTQNYRSYTNILSNSQQTYQSDVLFYRIKKFEQGSDTPIQNFWIPAEKGYRGIRYIDTQVKYGKMYRYEIHAFKFVIGTEYVFSEKDIGKINFSQDLESYEKGVSNTIEDLRALSGFRKEAQEELSAVPFGSIMVDDLTYRKMMNYLLKNDVNIGILNNAVLMAMGASQIALFANNIVEKGISQYKGVDFSFNDLTEEEEGDLLYIQFVWKKLTNNWILGEGPTEKNTLFELEKLTQNAKVISLIKEIINNAGDSNNTVIEDLKGDQLDIIRRGITQIVTVPRIEGFSFDEDLNPDDSLSGLYGFAYYSFLDEDLAANFRFGR